MLNLFKSKKEPGKAPRKGQTPTNRTGPSDSKSWFGNKTTTKPAIKKSEQIKSISASSPALNNNNEKKRGGLRPLSVAADNVTLRRGQQPSKVETPTPEDLSRASSITNLNADQKAKGAKPKKADSKDKLDKIVEKKHEKRTISKNNNKESAIDSLTDVESLQKQLAQMANDKSNLALQLGEQTGQLNKLQNEIAHLKMLQEDSTQKLEQLLEENTILRNRLRDVAHSPLSDTEKQQLLYESHRHHNSAPASIATNLLDDGGDITTCPTPEWDKRSSSNVSEVSVACLQDKINQMQETHYSTNEELQATLQELTDLQRQLSELQGENVRLNEEKNLMFDSLCRQTERLNDSRNEVESLKQLLYKDENGQFETAAEREQKLVDLLKSAQEERESLLMKQEQLGNELDDTRSSHVIQTKEIAQLTERVKTLESTLDAKHAEHKQLDQELAQAKDQSSSRQIEINRLKDLLENARTKIGEMEQDRTLSDKSELDELLDNARKEKDALESEVAHLKEKLALSKNEIEKLKEQVSILQEECKVIRNNAKTTQSDLEYKVEKLLSEKSNLTEQLQQFQEALNELQVQAQCQIEDKRQLSAVLSETQRNLNESERRINDLENELTELKKTKQEQEEEWEKFQNDLLTSVRVANDFKTEAQQDLQKFIMENKAGRERIKQLETQIEKLKGANKRKVPVSRLSNEEMLISSLNQRYEEIDGLPDEQLTDEQKAIKVLKLHYEKDFPRQKPIAHKSKDKLAISKPSLESVISNPKLEKIVRDSRLQNVETITYFSDDEQKYRQSLISARLTLIDSIGASVEEMNLQRHESFPKIQSDSGLEIDKKQFETHIRSQSLSDLPNVGIENEPKLRRCESTENLAALSKVKKPHKKSTVNMQTLEKICREIDPDLPEDQLTKEQRLALRMREILNRQGKKPTLKKKPNLSRKKIIISRPTQESVQRNSKLYQILKNPVIKNVESEIVYKAPKRNTKVVRKTKERYSMPASSSHLEDTLTKSKKSKSYNDITFKFQVPDMYSGEENLKSFELESVLPPEGFRDPIPSVVIDNSVFDTFQCNNNTFKREHNYLDLDATPKDNMVKENRDLQTCYETEDNLDGRISPEGANLDDATDLNQSQFRNELNEVFVADASQEFDDSAHILETVNDTITKRLELEDDLIYRDDEEVLEARRGLRQRYSQVVEEFKEKFDKSSDEEEPETQPKKFDTSDEFQKLQTNISELVDKSRGDEDNEGFVQLPVTELEDFEEVALEESSDSGGKQLPDENYRKNLEDIDVDSESEVTEVDDDFKHICDATRELSLTNFDAESKIELASDPEANILFDEVKRSKSYEENSSQDNFERIEAENRDICSNLDAFDGFTFEEIQSNRNSLETLKIDLDKNPNNDKNYSEILTAPLDISNESTILKNDESDHQPKKPKDDFDISDKNNKINLAETDKTSAESQFEILTSTDEDRKSLEASDLTQDKIDVTDNKNSQEDNSLSETHTLEVSITSIDPKPSNLTEDELQIIDNIKCDSDSRKLSEIKPTDLKLIAEMTEKYLAEEPNLQQAVDNSKLNENLESTIVSDEIHKFPSILPPTRLSQPSTYEPVYANFDVTGNRDSNSRTSSFSGKKPKALPRIGSLNTGEPLYQDFGGQIRKTRFSITYERKKGDSFKERNQQKSVKVKEIKEMFESKANKNFRDLVSKALEDGM